MILATELQQFVDWTKLKIQLHQSDMTHRFDEREIWWVSLGINIGTEENGKNFNFERPALVLKKFDNLSLWIIPLSSKIKDGHFYYLYQLDGVTYSAILMQLRLISSKRLLRRIGHFPKPDFQKIHELLINFL